MENILPCHPKDLPKLEDKTVLTLPISISVVFPADKVNFWQSENAYSFIWISIFSVILSFAIQFFSYTFLPMKKFNWLEFFSFPLMIMILIIMFLKLSDIYIKKTGKNIFNDVHNDLKINHWKSIKIINFDKESVKFFGYFSANEDTAEMNDIKKFTKYMNKPAFSGFDIIFRNNNSKTYFFYNKYYLINDLYLIQPLEILNLLNSAKVTTNNQITFLSMDNYDNLMDIGL